MFEEFTVIEEGYSDMFRSKLIKYQFKNGKQLVHSWYYLNDEEITLHRIYYGEYKAVEFSFEELIELKKMILNRKEIRLRHLLKPYKIF